jgi:hypothetical protein
VDAAGSLLRGDEQNHRVGRACDTPGVVEEFDGSIEFASSDAGRCGADMDDQALRGFVADAIADPGVGLRVDRNVSSERKRHLPAPFLSDISSDLSSD